MDDSSLLIMGEYGGASGELSAGDLIIWLEHKLLLKLHTFVVIAGLTANYRINLLW